MRLFYAMPFALLPAALPAMAWAEDIVLDAPVAAVEIFPQGARVTRIASFQVPQGDHRLIVPDLPESLRETGRSISMQGQLTQGPASYAYRPTPLHQAPRAPEYEAVLEEVRAARAALQDVLIAYDTAAGRAEAAAAEIAYARSLGQGAGDSPDPEELDQIADIVRQRIVAATVARAEAQRDMAALEHEKKLAEEALKAAEARLSVWYRPGRPAHELSVEVSAETAGEAQLTFTYFVDNAGWAPSYELHLDRSATPALRVERSAVIHQDTGEHWRDASITLTTMSPSNRTAAQEPYPWLRRIYEEPPTVGITRQSAPKRGVGADMAMEEMALAEAAPAPAFEARQAGLNVSYAYPDPVTLLSQPGVSVIPLDTLEYIPDELLAAGAPINDPAAYLRATFTNDTSEVILPGEGTFYLDGVLVGSAYLPQIAAGEETELGFGEIRGLQLERIVNDREEGDRGIISRSNEETEEVTLRVTNLTGEAWDLLLLDRVPYSEQEDLRITWQATPQPAEERYDDRRGVLAWEKRIAPGEEWEVALSYRLSWPEGMFIE